ncbi:SDR family NAD(P)-dependent oxidoreductase [Actinophytocola sp.]|uniref:SDR family NAD(P)-dependent oxidoreductase n=1 Tax=Actinophytocola sp. TaxID=1872138 RepID=UPI002D7EC619|nr:SDR family NAD(P)-dependent oxidoreductase [Actinophytocola sp.]HET9143582.1 SDR family NAD(P)-dependent oxidoreductase [Actinophytocola sp.]
MSGARSVLVTGANRGIGRAVAELLSRSDWRVVVGARDGDEAAAVAAALGARPVAIDTTDPDSVKRAREAIGPVDALVNNAGVLLDAGTDPLSVPLDLVERTLAVNLLGSWRVCQEFVPAMVERGWGRVVIVSSGTATFHNGLFAGAPGYSVSKTALNGLTTMLAAQTRNSGVLVNAVNPGMTRTRMMPKAQREPADAARDIVHAVTLPDDGPTGAFLRGREQIEW